MLVYINKWTKKKVMKFVKRLTIRGRKMQFSNNFSENAIRPFAVGRKNWLFSDTPKGAEASAMVYTMVEMVKTHNQHLASDNRVKCPH